MISNHILSKAKALKPLDFKGLDKMDKIKSPYYSLLYILYIYFYKIKKNNNILEILAILEKPVFSTVWAG